GGRIGGVKGGGRQGEERGRSQRHGQSAFRLHPAIIASGRDKKTMVVPRPLFHIIGERLGRTKSESPYATGQRSQRRCRGSPFCSSLSWGRQWGDGSREANWMSSSTRSITTR